MQRKRIPQESWMNRRWALFFRTLRYFFMGLCVLLFWTCASEKVAGRAGSLPNGSKAIIIDHTCTDLSKIPAYWIAEAKKLTIHFAHTSHGSQLVTGAFMLEKENATYTFAEHWSDSILLPDEPGALLMWHHQGNPGSYWESHPTSGGDARKAGDSGLFNVSMFAWCSQLGSYSVARVQQYLDALDRYEQKYPHMRFVYMTGHTNQYGDNTLKRNNKMIRDYCIANNKVLYDFADIESWDPDGNFYPRADDACLWCSSWCSSHECPSCGECAHSHCFNCYLKGKAFWWMMARLAGWSP